MPVAGMERLLEQHAKLLQGWREQLERLESGKVRHFTKGDDGRWNVDVTPDLIAAIKRDIAVIEAVDKHYRA